MANEPDYDDDFFGTHHDDDMSDDCDHDDYEVDIVTGRATCNMCDHSWYQTAEETAAEIERQKEYDKHCEQLNADMNN